MYWTPGLWHKSFRRKASTFTQKKGGSCILYACLAIVYCFSYTNWKDTLHFCNKKSIPKWCYLNIKQSWQKQPTNTTTRDCQIPQRGKRRLKKAKNNNFEYRCIKKSSTFRINNFLRIDLVWRFDFAICYLLFCTDSWHTPPRMTRISGLKS